MDDLVDHSLQIFWKVFVCLVGQPNSETFLYEMNVIKRLYKNLLYGSADKISFNVWFSFIASDINVKCKM